MEYLHRVNVVHGDLKTPNILIRKFDISKDDGRPFIVVKVADFGGAQVSMYMGKTWATRPCS